MRRRYIYAFLCLTLLGTVILTGCGSGGTASEEPPRTSGQEEEAVTAPAWMDIELTDIRTGETFRISDFKGKPILLESFAVWCPTCLSQQKQIEKLYNSEGESIVHISVDTDPNEDAERVRQHITRYGFEWYFAVSPIEMTNALIKDFGLTVVSAPSAPVVLIDADQSARLLPNGVKSPEDLLAEIDKGS